MEEEGGDDDDIDDDIDNDNNYKEIPCLCQERDARFLAVGFWHMKRKHV